MNMKIGKSRDKSNYVVIQIDLKKVFTYVGNIRIYFKYIFNCIFIYLKIYLKIIKVVFWEKDPGSMLNIYSIYLNS